MNKMESNAAESKRSRFWEKSIKKTVYRVQTRSWRAVIVWALIIGILCAAAYVFVGVYQNYASAYAHVSMVYPQIANGKYPDGSRFTTYDLIAEDRIAEALAQMQSQGKYENFTPEQLAGQFDIHTYTEGSVAEDVSSLRSEGNNYSYFANEYRLSFAQPHDYKAIEFRERLLAPDYSEQFLEALMQAELKNIQKYYGGADGFSEMTNVGDLSSQDYSERVITYHTRIAIILRYLRHLNVNSGGFVSESTGKDLMDLISHYEVLYGERLNQIYNFIQTSGVTTDLETLTNKLNIRLEEFELQNNILNDEVQINRHAMNSYDHTFSENLIVVSTSNRSGLYQARPKTAFDTVVDQYNAAVNNAINCKAKINDLNREIQLFTSVTRQTQEYNRLVAKCEELLKAFEADYYALRETAIGTISDYLAQSNEMYISYKVGTNKAITKDVITRAAVIMVGAAVLVFVLNVIWSAIVDFSRICRKKRKLKRLNSYREKLKTVN